MKLIVVIFIKINLYKMKNILAQEIESNRVEKISIIYHHAITYVLRRCIYLYTQEDIF